jgi:hypothetical protein
MFPGALRGAVAGAVRTLVTDTAAPRVGPGGTAAPGDAGCADRIVALPVLLGPLETTGRLGTACAAGPGSWGIGAPLITGVMTTDAVRTLTLLEAVAATSGSETLAAGSRVPVTAAVASGTLAAWLVATTPVETWLAGGCCALRPTSRIPLAIWVG